MTQVVRFQVNIKYNIKYNIIIEFSPGTITFFNSIIFTCHFFPGLQIFENVWPHFSSSVENASAL